MFIEQENYKPDLDYDAEYLTDCENSGCGEDDYCRCGYYNDVTVNNNTTSFRGFFEQSYTKKKTDLDEVLDFWFTKLHFKDIAWGFTSEGDYYGEYLSSIFIENDGGFFQKANGFCELSTKEKLHFLLTMEYLKVLDCIKEVNEWELKKVKIKDVVQSANPNLLSKVREDYVTNLKHCIMWSPKKTLEYFKILAPLCVNDGKKYRIIDGRHRLAAISSDFEAYDKKTVKWVRYSPKFMYIICPKKE